jgi:hypothetical protein
MRAGLAGRASRWDAGGKHGLLNANRRSVGDQGGAMREKIRKVTRRGLARRCRGNRSDGGFYALEFALILPLFVVFALLVVLFQEMMLRAACNSHAAFAASRRCGVDRFSGTGSATAYVERHYEGCSMRGSPDVNTRTDGRHPKKWSTTVVDRYTILWPSERIDGVVPELKKREFAELAVTEQAAGTSYQVPGSDNDL